jgi:hypothetical protein
MSAHKNLHALSFFLLLVVAQLALTGCRNRGSAGPAEPDVIARVNGYRVLRSELDKAYNTQVAAAPQKPSSTQEEELRLQILEQIIQTRMILQRAEKLGVKINPDDVQALLTKAKAPYTQEQFQKKLKDIGLTEDEYKTYLEHGLTVDKVIEKEIKPRVNVSEADVNAFYDQHKAQIPPSANESDVKRQIREKLRSEIEQLLKVAYTDKLRNEAEIHNYYAEQVFDTHKAESK